MRKGNLFILLLAIAMGGVAAYLAREWIAAHAVSSAEQSGTIVVAAMPLSFGTVLSGENVTEIYWPSGKMPEGAYATRDELFVRIASILPGRLRLATLHCCKTFLAASTRNGSSSCTSTSKPKQRRRSRHWDHQKDCRSSPTRSDR